MCIGIFLPEVLRGFLEFLDRLIPKVCQLLLECIALIRRCLLQINLRLLFLIYESIAGIEVRFQPLHFVLRLFRLLHLFLSRGALLGDDILEVDVDFRVFTALYSALGLVWRLFVIRRREYNKYAVNARAQVRQAKFAYAIRLGLLLCALIAYSSNVNLRPGLPIHIQDCAANRSGLGRSLWCKYPCQRGHQDGDKRPRLMKTLHASFSFFTGRPARGIRAVCAPLSLSCGPIPSSVPGRNGTAVGNGVRDADFRESAQAQQAAIASAAGSIFVLVARPG